MLWFYLQEDSFSVNVSTILGLSCLCSEPDGQNRTTTRRKSLEKQTVVMIHYSWLQQVWCLRIGMTFGEGGLSGKERLDSCSLKVAYLWGVSQSWGQMAVKTLMWQQEYVWIWVVRVTKRLLWNNQENNGTMRNQKEGSKTWLNMARLKRWISSKNHSWVSIKSI